MVRKNPERECGCGITYTQEKEYQETAVERDEQQAVDPIIPIHLCGHRRPAGTRAAPEYGVQIANRPRQFEGDHGCVVPGEAAADRRCCACKAQCGKDQNGKTCQQADAICIAGRDHG